MNVIWNQKYLNICLFHMNVIWDQKYLNLFLFYVCVRMASSHATKPVQSLYCQLVWRLGKMIDCKLHGEAAAHGDPLSSSIAELTDWQILVCTTLCTPRGLRTPFGRSRRAWCPWLRTWAGWTLMGSSAILFCFPAMLLSGFTRRTASNIIQLLTFRNIF